MMVVRVEEDGPVWTVVQSHAEARNTMDPDSTDALVEAFAEFDRTEDAPVAVL